jgi:hypothetical protein
MQTHKVSRRFDIHPNGLMLFLALGSAIIGAAGGYALKASAASVPAAVESHSVAAVSQPAARINAVPAVKAYPFASENVLRQEQLDIRQAQKAATINSSTAVKPLDATSFEQELRQEQYDLRHANAQSVPVQSATVGTSQQAKWLRIMTLKESQLEPQIPASVSTAPKVEVTFPSQQELWQEHLDLLKMQGTWQAATAVPSVSAPASATTAELYQTLKARQIEGFETLP